MSTTIQTRRDVDPGRVQIELRKEGDPIDYQAALRAAPSLAAAVMATNRALVSIDAEIDKREKEIEALKERLELHATLGLPTRGVKATITRRKKQISTLGRRRNAHEAYYIEVPDMGGDPLRMGDHEDDKWNTETLDATVPLDVLQAIAYAKGLGLFDEFRIYLPDASSYDPMIVGVIRRNPDERFSRADACFYVASWR